MYKVFLDFETFFSKDYSLRKMTPIEYVKDARFETIGCSIAINDKEPVWLEGDKIAPILKRIQGPWMAVSHNALFDMVVLSMRYGIVPPVMACTMAMSQAMLKPFTPRGSVSLATVAEYLGVGEKGKELTSALGWTLEMLKGYPQKYQEYQEYCRQDNRLCRAIFKHLSPTFPISEFAVMDMVIRMAAQPQFTVDQTLLWDHLAQVKADKARLLASTGADRDTLMSNDKLAGFLSGLGVEPPTKISPSDPEKRTFAFAKSDAAFTDLLEHDNPLVQALVAARLGVKSTLEETRTEKFIRIAEVTSDGNQSWMPIPLKYSGAHTHRFSGEWRLNLQNLPSRKQTTLRRALTAPPSHAVVTVDAAQIEARLVAWLSGQDDLTQQFFDGSDVYSLFASDLYGITVGKKTHPNERFVGKKSILGLGFGMGAAKFYATVAAEIIDFDMDLVFTLEDAGRAVTVYRGKYARIGATWRHLNNLIPRMYNGTATGETFGPCTVDGASIILPSGLRLYYPDLQYKARRWTYQSGRYRKDLYGVKILENIVQALDRVHVMEAAVRIRKRVWAELQYRLVLAHQVHDELVYVPPTSLVDDLKPILLEEMSRRPWWGPDLPLAAECGQGPSYGTAK